MKRIFIWPTNVIRNIPVSVKASIAFIVCNVLVRGISFITLPVFSRMLSTEEYGQLTIYSSWSEILALFGTITIWGGVFNTGLIRNEEEKASYVSKAQGLGITISVAFSFIGFFLSKQISSLLELSWFLTICIFIHIIVLIPYNIWLSANRFDYKYKAVVLVTLVNSIANPVISYFLVRATTAYKVEARVLGGLFVEAIISIILFIVVAIRGRRFFDKKVWKFLFVGNIVLIPHYLSMQLLSHSDRLMIGKLCGEGAAGVYGIAYTFAMLLALVGTGIEATVNPYIFKSIKSNRKEGIQEIGTFVALFMAVMCVLLICVIPEVFHLMLPETYYESLRCIPPVAIGAYFMFLSFLFSCIEFYYGETKQVAIVSGIYAGFNVLLNYIFICLFGYIAAAYTTLICYLGIFVTHYFVMRKVQQKNNDMSKLYDIKSIGIVSGIFMVFSLIITVFYEYIVVRYLILTTLIMVLFIRRKYFVRIFAGLLKKGEE